MEDEEPNVCAFMDDEGNECSEKPEWLIVSELEDEDYVELVESCTGHVGRLLDPDAQNTVFALDNSAVEGIIETTGHGGTVAEIQTCPHRFNTAPTSERHHGMDTWEYNTPEPFQRCSYCNSIRPEDAIELTEKGWVLERSWKDGEFYLLPDPSKKKNTRFKGQNKVLAHHCNEDQTVALLRAAYGGVWVREGDYFTQYSDS